MARIARQAGKQVAMTEAWLYKVGWELSRGFTAPDIFGRDALSFWEPLDQKFLAVMVKFLALSTQAAAKAMVAGQYTQTGLAYKALIAPPR